MAKKKPVDMQDEDLAEMYALIDKQVRPGAGRARGQQEDYQPLELISTGSFGVDFVSHGGIPRGRITEIYGPQHSGKTTLMMSTAGRVQAGGGRVAWIDMEYGFDDTWATTLGVNVDKLHIDNFDTAEEALKFMLLVSQSNKFDLVVLDSVAALVPTVELAEDFGKSHMGLQARLMSQAMRKLQGPIGKTRTAVVFLNQIRNKIGVMYGSPETTPGGLALPFAASLRIDIRQRKPIKEGEELLGNYVEAICRKCRAGPYGRRTLVPLYFASGIDKAMELLDAASEAGLIEKSGSHYKYQGEKIGQGQVKAAEWLRAHPDVIDALWQPTLDYVAGIQPGPDAPVDP